MGVRLEPLGAARAAEYAALFRRNAAHLNLERAEANLSDQAMAQRLVDPADSNVKLAILLGDVIIGRLDLNPVAPPKYSIGYWVDLASCCRGYGTAAVRLGVAYAKDVLEATDVYAGVSHGNEASVKVLLAAGFVKVADMGSYERFHRPLDGGQPRQPD